MRPEEATSQTATKMPVEWVLLPEDVWGEIALRRGCFLPLCRTKEIPFRREEVASLLLQRGWRRIVGERLLPPQKGDRVALLLPKNRLLTGTVEMFGSEEDEERMVYFTCSDGRKVLFWNEVGKEGGGE